MLISASRRTDIPAYYTPWFLNRLQEGFVWVRNPMRFHQVSRVSLLPSDVDGIVLWTKNPIPLMERLDELQAYPYTIQFTLTPYGREVEPGLPSKKDKLLPAFQKLAKSIGPERLVWRYDPIFCSPAYPAQHHCKLFAAMAERLAGCTHRCTVSFLDEYPSIARQLPRLGLMEQTEKERMELLLCLREIAAKHGIELDVCAESMDTEAAGIPRARCVDAQRLAAIGGIALRVPKDPNQRKECGCVQSIDIGAYSSCGNGCVYCYANHAQGKVRHNMSLHDPSSPLLYGTLSPEDQVTVRRMNSCKACK